MTNSTILRAVEFNFLADLDGFIRNPKDFSGTSFHHLSWVSLEGLRGGYRDAPHRTLGRVDTFSLCFLVGFP